MTPTDQHTESPGTPNGRRPRTRFVSVRTVLGSAVAIATVAGAGVLGFLTLAVDDESVATGRPASGGALEEAPASAWPATSGTPTCSIWSFPSLEVPSVPQSNLTEGVPYVAVCVDADEETTFVFLYGHDNHTPAPRQ